MVSTSASSSAGTSRGMSSFTGLAPRPAAILAILSALACARTAEAWAPAQILTSGARQWQSPTTLRARLSAANRPDEVGSTDEATSDALVKGGTSSRRQAISSALVSAAAAAAFPSAAIALELPSLPGFLQPPDRRSNGGVYRQARRATAYLVDSTIPPTLVPFRAAREAAILKELGQGSGTDKEPFIEVKVNLNNIAQKGVFGTADLVKKVAGTSGGQKDGGDDDTVAGIAKRTGPGYSSFVFLGVNYASSEDADLAEGLMNDILKPRQRGDQASALGLAFAPLSTQGALDAYTSGGSEADLVDAMARAEADQTALDTFLPLIRFARSKRLSLLALAPEVEDERVVRSEGLQNVNIERRQAYVADAEGFIALTQDPKYKLYAEKSLLKDFRPRSAKESQGDFFAERILVHEAAATALARWAKGKPDALAAVVAPTADVRFLGGPNGRLPRVSHFLDPESKVDEGAITTILLNPSAEETLSMSRFLRLEIGTTPRTLQYQTKVADYLWFSSMPKVNMLPRMMNYR